MPSYREVSEEHLWDLHYIWQLYVRNGPKFWWRFLADRPLSFYEKKQKKLLLTLTFHRRKAHRFHMTCRWVDDNSIWLSGCAVPLRANAPGFQKSVNCEWRVQLSSVCVCVCVSLWWITLSLSPSCFYTDQWANGVLEQDNSFTSVHTHTHTHMRPTPLRSSFCRVL